LGGGVNEGEDRGVHLQIRITGPVIVTGDRARLSAVLKALIHSALQERHEPGVIVVECSTLPGEGQKWAVVTIGDEAISQSLLAAAWDTPPYFDEWREGLGLALPVGRGVIEAHGGALWSLPVGAAARTGSGIRLPVTT